MRRGLKDHFVPFMSQEPLIALPGTKVIQWALVAGGATVHTPLELAARAEFLDPTGNPQPQFHRRGQVGKFLPPLLKQILMRNLHVHSEEIAPSRAKTEKQQAGVSTGI